MATSLLVLLDDITSVLDDVALLTKVAAKKTTGVMGDDLALNAEQASGVRVDRELPVVWAVAKGSLVNKAILVPVALLISAFAPGAVMPLMLVGGLFLCYEGVEKLLHKALHRHEGSVAAPPSHRMTESDDAARLALEQVKIKGAIRTDFVLSAEIIVIALGTMSDASIGLQIGALSAVGIAATVFVYGLVAGIVKLDDLGLALHRRGRAIGGVILRSAPWLMKTLSVVGTAAMFTVGGGIIAHGVHAIDTTLDAWVRPAGSLAGVLKTVLSALLGVAAGAVLVAATQLVKRLRGRWGM